MMHDHSAIILSKVIVIAAGHGYVRAQSIADCSHSKFLLKCAEGQRLNERELAIYIIPNRNMPNHNPNFGWLMRFT